MVINGTQGPNYFLLTSSNFAIWQVLSRTNSPLLPLRIEVTNNPDAPDQFYRVEVGPRVFLLFVTIYQQDAT
jgi:hypothetical protein